MNKTLNTQVVLEHKLNAEAVDLIERAVAAGHEVVLTDQGPQPTVLFKAGKAPFSAKMVLEISKWAHVKKERDLVQAFRVLSRYYPDGMEG